jgi:hypothetical protein
MGHVAVTGTEPGVPPPRSTATTLTDLATAEWFARGKLRGREVGQVWTADVAPERLLARMHEHGRGESEYVSVLAGCGSLRSDDGQDRWWISTGIRAARWRYRV